MYRPRGRPKHSATLTSLPTPSVTSPIQLRQDHRHRHRHRHRHLRHQSFLPSMPAQGPSSEAPSPLPPPRLEDDDSLQSNQRFADSDEEDDSEDISDLPEFISVKYSEIRKDLQCPICLGVIRKTRTVMECLHRFCKECIEKAMRLGNNECPVCRTHCASRRSLRDDPNFDALIKSFFPDIDKYEEEELAFHEEEKTHNKQMQASLTQILSRQSEAPGRKRTTARAIAAAFVRISQGNYRNFRGRNHRADVLQGSDNEDDIKGHDGGKYSSSADERCTEVEPKRYKRSVGARFSQPSLAAGSADGGCDENDSEVNRESVGASTGLVGSSEMLAWGTGGMGSHMRYGSLSVGNGRNATNSRLSKLLDCLRNSGENDDGLDIHLMLVSMDEHKIPNLQQPNLCCRPTLSVKELCQYVAIHTDAQSEDVEMLLAKELHSKHNPSASSSNNSISESIIIDPFKDELHLLEEHETLMDLQKTMCNFGQRHLLLAYRQKSSGLGNS